MGTTRRVVARYLQTRTACVIAAGTFGGSVCLVKNRDRNYVPKVKIVRDVFDGVEVAYILDTLTDWSEGMNEHGIGIVNSALMVGRDEAEKKLIKDVGKKSKDGERIREALAEDNLEDALEVVCHYHGGVQGHTLVSDGKKVRTVESTSENEAVVKVVDDGDVIVRTNHGDTYKDVGYTEGDDYVSSSNRMHRALKALNDVDDPKELALSLVKSRLKDHHSIKNPVRDTDKMRTTSQLVMDLKTKTLMLWLIPGKVDFQGVENRLPKGRKPTIKVEVYRYKNMKDEDPDYEQVKV